MGWIANLRGKTVGLDMIIRTPDVIQLSAALNAGTTHFFTNDVRLPNIPSNIFFA